MTSSNPIVPPTPLHTAAEIELATKELAKLPLLGPVLWLYARDPQRKYTFVADMDFRLPSLVKFQSAQMVNIQSARTPVGLGNGYGQPSWRSVPEEVRWLCFFNGNA